ncbi:MAG TPA: pilus assembly protein TadG-related protein [Asticcacaulis sp.]|nr:pilus assembly protein TadG-related protein [Asticcacaulis sp.]
MKFISRFLQSLRANCRGNVTTIVALSIIPTVTAVGGGVDFANVLNARARLQDASDSAAIAAALDTSGVLATQQTAANKSFNANIAGSNLSSATGQLTTTTENNVQMMNYTATARVPTFILGLVGISNVDIKAFSKAGVAINTAEIAFVLDNTGSMAQDNKMSSLKSSLDSVLASLLDANGNNTGKTKVALVPFDTQVALSSVANMTGYAGNFGTVTQGYTCTSLSSGQCDAVTSAATNLCNWVTNNYGSTAGTSCSGNTATYTRTSSSSGNYYVFTSATFANPSYGCNHNCYYSSSYRYITVYRLAAYSVSGSTASQQNNSTYDSSYYSYSSTTSPNAWSINNSSSYAQYSGSITYGYPTAGGYNSGSSTVYKDNNTVTANSDLLGVGTANWSGCVIDRTQPYDVQADAPVTSNSNTLYPAAKCATPSLLPIMELTTDIAGARSYAAKMTPAGNTNITIGVQWGMEVLSPTAPFSTGAQFTDTTVSKYMIVLTDGLNTQNRWTTKSSDIDARTALACQSAKNLGITVFTVRLEDGNSDMLSACASKTGYYYNLSNSNQISGALGGIMKSIKKIRLTQ